jgi:hypothetical protein
MHFSVKIASIHFHLDHFERFWENGPQEKFIMVVRRNEMEAKIKEKMRNGEGSASFVHLAGCEHEKNIRMLAVIVTY